MDEFARTHPRIPTFLLNPRILTRTRFPRWKLGHVKEQLARQSDRKARFTKFPTLPAELRLKIWEHAVPDRRRISINRTRIRDREGMKSYYEVYPYEPSPAILFVNAESRAVALEMYQPLLTKVEGGLSGGVVYMNFEKDVLYLDDVYMLWADDFPGIEFDLNRVKHVALRNRTTTFPWQMFGPSGTTYYPTAFLEPFHSLETLFIHDDTRNLPRHHEIFSTQALSRHQANVPTVSGINDAQRFRFHHLWRALEELARQKKPGEAVVKRPKVLCRLSWLGIKYFDEQEYHELRKAQFRMEAMIEHTWRQLEVEMKEEQERRRRMLEHFDRVYADMMRQNMAELAAMQEEEGRVG